MPQEPHPSAPALEPAATYQLRAARFGQELARLERRARTNGNLNLVIFFAAAAALTTGAVREEVNWYWLAGGLGVAFLIALAALQSTRQAVAHAATLLALAQEGTARLARTWAALPPPPAGPAAHAGRSLRSAQAAGEASPLAIDPATAADLDLLGPGSLQHLLNTPATPIGQATLRAWLLQPAPPAVVAARQAAARELAPLIDLRDTLAARGRRMGGAQEHYERFVAWSESAPWLVRQPLLLWAARLLPLLALLLGLAIWLRWPLTAGLPLYPLLGGVLLATLFLALTAGNRAAATIAEVEAEQQVFATYAQTFTLLSAQTFAAPALQHLQAALGPQAAAAGHRQTGSAVQMMGRLQRLMPLASIRRWLLFMPVELLTLWNLHLLWLLEGWQAQAGAQVAAWLNALGEFEALAALATLHHDHPHWCFGTLAPAQAGNGQTSGQPQIRAANLAHPLLPPALAVGNDVTLGPPGSFLLVTGSNMSGKSTLLRAIGLNCVLTQMGAPACADRLELPPVGVVSSMRVQDSLTSGVSYFLAELQSLKAIVDRAEQATSSQPISREDAAPLMLYLLDEILQGTNSAERQIAARHIIERLMGSSSIGAVSTHDLTLAAAPELAAAAVPVHFTEHFTAADAGSGDGPTMVFDYKLRPGIATSTNALRLMQVIGLYPLDEAASSAVADKTVGRHGRRGHA